MDPIKKLHTLNAINHIGFITGQLWIIYSTMLASHETTWRTLWFILIPSLYAKINPQIFISGPGSGEMSNSYERFDHELQDLHFHSFEFYSPTKKCLLYAYVNIALNKGDYRTTDDITIPT